MHFIFACDHPQRKTFTMGWASKPVQKAAKANTYWISDVVSGVDSLESLSAAIKGRLKHPKGERFAVMRGVWHPLAEMCALEEQRKAHITEMGKQGKPVPASQMVPFVRKGEKHPHFLRRKGIVQDLPINWVCFDFDGLQIEGMGDFDVANPVPWAQKAIGMELGPDFACADYVLQLSSSAGLKPGISAHCWFWLEKPMDGAAWRAWYARRTRELGRKPRIDKTLFERERIHYIATPKFDGGTIDPVAEAEHQWYSNK